MTEWEVAEPVRVQPETILPIGYGAFRTLRNCSLQFAFAHDRRFPHRINPQARIGSAFHEAMAALRVSIVEGVDEVLRIFSESIRRHRDEANHNYRERRLTWPRKTIEDLENTLAVLATGTDSSLPGSYANRTMQRVETTIVSSDGLLVGRPDEIVSVGDELEIIDYKTGRLEEDDIYDFEDQVHFYAGLWAEAHGCMPKRGRIQFIVDRRSHSFPIDVNRSAYLMESARELAKATQKPIWSPIANVGHHCRYCDYRPWCSAYWSKQDTVSINEVNDLEGHICGEHVPDSKAFCLRSSNVHISIVNKDQEPLPFWTPVMQVRALDLAGDGPVRYRMTWSEIFRVTQSAENSRQRVLQ